MMRALLACKAAVDSLTLHAVVVHTTVVCFYYCMLRETMHVLWACGQGLALLGVV